MFLLYGLRLAIGLALLTLAVPISCIWPFAVSLSTRGKLLSWGICLASLIAGLWLVRF